MHEEGLQSHLGVGPQVSRQQRRAAVVPRINRLQTARQPRINRSSTGHRVPVNGLHRIQYVSVPKRTLSSLVSNARGHCEGRRSEMVHRGSPIDTQPLAAEIQRPPPYFHPPPSPSRVLVCPGFGLDRFRKTIRRRSTGQQPATKSGRGPADKPLTNRLPTAYQPLVNRLSCSR